MKQSSSENTSISIRDNCLYYADPLSSNIDAVILPPEDYRKIFGDRKASMPTSSKRLSVVKISFDGKSIHRRYLGEPNLKNCKYASLNYSSLLELVNEKPSEVIGHEVTLSKGSRLKYYWNNPANAIRMSTRLGVISLTMAIVSIVLSIID